MKKVIYNLINRLGYNIENKKRIRRELIKPLEKFGDLENFNLLVQAKNYILNLDNKFDNLNIVNHKEGFIVSFSDLKIYVESLEEFHILNEVFINEDYRFINKNNAILIDIGANIGITSLFFSKFNYIYKIYGFEPIQETYKQAIYNLQLNKNIHKVEWIKNIGLGKDDRKETFLFDKNTKGNTGVRGLLSPSYTNNRGAIETDVLICDASVEIINILNENKDKKVIVKMDCEGAEYEILDNLYKSGVINKIDVILLEWHDKGFKLIEDILLKSGFDFFAKDFSPVAGMVYAYKI